MIDHTLPFPWTLDRVGGAPVSALDGLLTTRLNSAVDEVSHRRHAAENASDAAVDVLYDAVPGLDTELRRAALDLKRDAHNDREPDVQPGVVTDVVAELDEPGDDAVLGWYEAQRAVTRAEDEADEAFEQDVASIAAFVDGWMGDDAISRAVALASPAFSRALDDQPVSGVTDPTSRTMRTAVGYLCRAAVKPSPFSWFTTLQLGRVQRHLPTGDPTPALASARSQVHVVQALACEIVDVMARHGVGVDDWELLPNAFVDADEDAGPVWTFVPMYQFLQDNFFWRRDDVVDARQYQHLVEVVARHGRGTLSEWRDALATEGLPPAVLPRLLDTRALRPVLPPALPDTMPVESLADELDAHHGAEVAAVAAGLRSLRSTVLELPDADAGERVDLLDDVAHAATDLFSGLEQPRPQWLDPTQLVYENVRGDHDVVSLGEDVVDDLSVVADVLSPRLFRGHLHDHVRAIFLEDVGAGGTCEDILGFVARHTAGEEAIQRFQVTAMQDQAVSDDEVAQRSVVTGPGVLPPTALVMFQLVARDAAAIAAGDYRLVVNDVSLGGLGYFCRYRGLMEEDRLADDLGTWLTARADGARLLEAPVALDYNGLQHRSSALLPQLRWPTEMTQLEEAVPPDELVLTHDAQSDRLVLADRGGTPVALTYTGVVPTTLISGPVRHLLAVSSPWALDHHPRDRFRDTPRPAPAPDDVVESPRVTEGRVVLQRRCWRMPRAAFPLADTDSIDRHAMTAFDRWRSKHDMPAELFVRVERRSQDFGPNPKPLWLHTASPPALAKVARSVTADVSSVLVVEALPARGQHWLRDRDGDPRVAEHAVLVPLQPPREAASGVDTDAAAGLVGGAA